MNPDFHLTNEGAPAFQKPDPEAFQPMTTSMKTRQAIYSALKKNPKTPVSLREFQEKTNLDYSHLRQAFKRLVRAGLARRDDITEIAPTKNNPERKVKRVAIIYVEPWGPKTSGAW